jgi:hypothetical protein
VAGGTSTRSAATAQLADPFEGGAAQGARLGRTPWFAAAGVTVGLLALAGRYGFHRDELYFQITGRHLAFGYADQPPFTPLVAHLQSALFGDSLLATRIWPALVAGAVVLLAALLARELGGDRRAQALAAVGVAASPGVLLAGHTLSTETTDVLVWQVIVLLAVRALRTGRLGLWAGVGAAVGVGLQNKDLPGFLAVALLAGLLISRRREVLTSRYFWFGALLSAAIAAPAVVWQLGHGLPQWQVAQAQRHGTGPVKYLVEQLLVLNPALLPAIVRGTRALARSHRYRPLLWTFVFLEAFFLATGGKAYYPAPMLILLAAAGIVAGPSRARTVDAAAARRRTVLPYAVIAGFGLVLAPAVLPVLPEAVFASSPYSSQDDARATIGWPQLAQQVDGIVERADLTSSRAAILTVDYGEAGALERFGDSGLPVYSGHNALWYYGRPDQRTQVILSVGYSQSDLAAWFVHCRQAGTLHTPHNLDNQENGTPISICTGTRTTWALLWARVRHDN